MGQQGSVSRSFHRKGSITVPVEGNDEETLLELALEAGAENFEQEGDVFHIVTEPNDFMTVVDALNGAEVAIQDSEITMLPETYMEVTDASQAQAVMRFVEALEELDDVQDVYTNMDVNDEVMAQLSAE